MGSYEEWVVDREVEAAWLQFRVRLADHLTSMIEGDRLQLAVAGSDGETVRLNARVLDDGDLRLRFITTNRRIRDAILRRNTVHSLGLTIPVDRVDESVLVAHDVLRLVAGAHHPSFVDVVRGDLVLVDPPKVVVAPLAEPEMPEAVVPESPDDLNLWITRVITERLGRAPRRNKNGSVTLSRDDARVTIRASSSRPIIEVSSVVATNVDLRKARKYVARMNARFHFFAFALVGNRIIVATTVDAHPFCPDHLNRAIDATFGYLGSEASKLQAKMARRERPATDVAVPDAPSNAIDGDLLLVFGACGDREAMMQMARGLTADSRDRLGQWRNAARGAAALARAKAALGGAGPVQNALIDQVIAWRSVADAIEGAVAEIVAEREASR